MKVLFEFDDKKFVMDAESAGEIVSLIHSRGAEILRTQNQLAYKGRIASRVHAYTCGSGWVSFFND
jgi:hypothetical protein